MKTEDTECYVPAVEKEVKIVELEEKSSWWDEFDLLPLYIAMFGED